MRTTLLSLNVFVLLFLATGNRATAQVANFRHYQVENGLSNNAVITAIQDKRGFLWLGTKDGLNRFDGYSFKIFRYDPAQQGSIGNNFIHSLYEDPHGTIWVGTERGLYRYNEKTESFTLIRPTSSLPVADMKMDRHGNLWFVQFFTLYRYDQQQQRITVFPIPGHFEVSSICTDPTGTLWASTPTGWLFRYDNDRNTFQGFQLLQDGSLWIEKIVPTRDGQILAGTSNGARIFNPLHHITVSLLYKAKDSTGIFVRNFLERQSGDIWIASENGIYTYDRATRATVNLQKAYNDPYSISDNAVYTLLEDSEGGVWAGTYFGGVNYFPQQATVFHKYFPKTGENSLSGNVVREIHADNKGCLWIGTEDAGLNKLDTATGLFSVFQPSGLAGSISYANIHGLLVDSGQLWIGTFEHGLDLMDLQQQKVIRHFSIENGSGLLSNFIYCLTRDAEGHILAGTTRGAYRYNKSTATFSVIEGLPLYNWYAHLLVDSRGWIWGATYGDGVNVFDPHTGKQFNYRHSATDSKSLSSDRVNYIYEDHNHRIWLGTEDGLCRFDSASKTFTTFRKEAGLPSNFILTVTEDNLQRLWLSTSNGIVQFKENSNSTIYRTPNGTLNDQYNFNSVYKDASGRLYYGSVKGMISFQPAAMLQPESPSPMYITGFQVFNRELPIGGESRLQQSISFTRKIVLPYDQSTLSIDFAALGFTAPEMTEYAYRMEGLDKNWTFLKQNRKAYFTDLAPGRYMFTVRKMNAVLDGESASLSIEILPPWWRSPWAYAGYILLAAALIAWLIRAYHRRTEAINRRRYELLEIAKDKEIFRAKVDFFTHVAHEIRTPLTLIKAPLEKVIRQSAQLPDLTHNLRIMDRNTNRLIELTNQLLDFRQTEQEGFSLNFVKANIADILDDVFAGFKELADQHQIEFRLQLPPQPVQAYIDLDAFHKILYNLFSNAIKYAATAAAVQLYPVKEDDTSFVLEVSSDGDVIPDNLREKIFEPFVRLRESEKKKGTGIGLALSRSLAALHNGSLQMASPVSEKNVFRLELPIRQQHEFNLSPFTQRRNWPENQIP
ncbi:sensor histidine kinase [Flavihumibacter petaseus]|uniref:histidine kinase n=1 Tax=Flavihumibacter petaseus NBRC 106054 TaxID=1220578 RepID=A0A0E9N252_9BACT|nr:sensor histidine kinase [Flavihumibacter petaseus]GAO43863.1 putative two-component histidine kinase [Flavihumibacter petaseus NBRC 106054]